MKLTNSLFAGALLVVSAALVSPEVRAQDWRLDPIYETVTLRAGFTPDPYEVRLVSGGSVDVQRNIGSRADGRVGDRRCRGFVANAPDVRLRFTAGSGVLPLIISVDSSADTTLVVNGPDGVWYCDDDSGQGLNPSLRFTNPQSGQYDIWVGTFGGSSMEPATLVISELRSR